VSSTLLDGRRLTAVGPFDDDEPVVTRSNDKLIRTSSAIPQSHVRVNTARPSSPHSGVSPLLGPGGASGEVGDSLIWLHLGNRIGPTTSCRVAQFLRRLCRGRPRTLKSERRVRVSRHPMNDIVILNRKTDAASPKPEGNHVDSKLVPCSDRGPEGSSVKANLKLNVVLAATAAGGLAEGRGQVRAPQPGSRAGKR
jgi:hypothetical protein